MKQIFLISGKARHGKDTLADLLIEELNGKSIKIAMADYLKYIATKYYGWNGQKDEVGRTILQTLGTNKIREELGWETFHAKRVCQDIEIIKKDYDYIFVPDCRFRNEILYTQAMFPYNTVTIRVVREGFENDLTEEQKSHRSEMELNEFPHDYRVCSSGGIDNLKKSIYEVMGGFIGSLKG